jgi:hypothetical protein
LSLDHNVALTQHSNDVDVVLRGSRAMAETLGLPVRAIDHLLQTKRLQSPRKLGGRWYVSRSKLLREFVGEDSLLSCCVLGGGMCAVYLNLIIIAAAARELTTRIRDSQIVFFYRVPVSNTEVMRGYPLGSLWMVPMAAGGARPRHTASQLQNFSLSVSQILGCWRR